MASSDPGGPALDLYQLLGVPRDTSQEEIALAWRRRARREHPDTRPADAEAPGRFRALTEAYRVLGDPARRAAYDRALARERPPAVRVTVRHQPRPDSVTPLTRTPGAPLWAGPVQVVASRPALQVDSRDKEDVRLALLAALALRYLAWDRGRPW